MKVATGSARERKLRAIFSFVLFALFVKILVMIVYEYRFYFPADFDSAFLTGRSDHFQGNYSRAFYIHIVSGPIALVLGAMLMFSGFRARFLRAHKLLGKLQMFMVIGLVSPSGFVMAMHAYTGPVAGLGFIMLASITAGCAIVAVYFAITQRIRIHQQWATRCFLCLCSPLLLRLFNGTIAVIEVESDLTYQMSAWFSWLVPLALYEVWRRQNIQEH